MYKNKIPYKETIKKRTNERFIKTFVWHYNVHVTQYGKSLLAILKALSSPIHKDGLVPIVDRLSKFLCLRVTDSLLNTLE